MYNKNPTSELYQSIEILYDYFNQSLFHNELPNVLFTTQRQNGMFGYFSADRWTNTEGGKCHEIAINPLYVAKSTLIELMQTLVHEMCHCWQYCYGKPSIKTYHNKEWSNKMKLLGLMPSSTGKPGGAMTGQCIADYPLPNGKFIADCERLMRDKKFKMPWLDVQASGIVCDSDEEKMEVLQQAFGGMDSEVVSQLTSSLNNLFNLNSDKLMNSSIATIKDNKRKRKYTCFECGLNVWGKGGLSVICGECDLSLDEC